MPRTFQSVVVQIAHYRRIQRLSLDRRFVLRERHGREGGEERGSHGARRFIHMAAVRVCELSYILYA